MTTRKRTLATFEDIANNNTSNNANTNVNANANVKNGDVVDAILGEQKAKKLVGIYFDLDVAEALDQLAGDRRGAKSALVNEALRRLLNEKGLI